MPYTRSEISLDLPQYLRSCLRLFSRKDGRVQDMKAFNLSPARSPVVTASRSRSRDCILPCREFHQLYSCKASYLICGDFHTALFVFDKFLRCPGLPALDCPNASRMHTTAEDGIQSKKKGSIHSLVASRNATGQPVFTLPAWPPTAAFNSSYNQSSSLPSTLLIDLSRRHWDSTNHLTQASWRPSYSQRLRSNCCLALSLGPIVEL